MAVELAKVSLWLDAFTLGAPLNFLDHHLRCGNSLIGATFEGLKKATEGELFSLNYEPLLRAINHVLFVSKMADATAAEVATSVSRYDQARESLAGYQIILDLLVAEYFGVREASDLVAMGSHLDLTDTDRFYASLQDDEERKLVAQVETLARRPDRRFFHWETEFPEVFFGFINAEHRQIKHKNQIENGTAGFDCVVGNPPYDVLAEKELETDLDEILGYFGTEAVFQAAGGGKQNLYKLFICRGVHVLRQGGRMGHIVPMPLLGDEQAVGVRKMLLSKSCLAAVEAFPQKDDPKNRVFEDAKLSTCIFVTTNKNEDAAFRARVHPGKVIEPHSPSLVMYRSQVKLYDPENQPIVACSQEDWDLVVRIMSSGRMQRLGNLCTAYQGEVNETTDGKKGCISESPKDGPLILRGANVCLYALRKASQGEALYLKKSKYLEGKRPDAKAWHHKQNRVGFQRNSPQNNFRRLIACHIPSGEFCCDTVSYFPEKESKLPLDLLLALFNSNLLDWFFRLGRHELEGERLSGEDYAGPCLRFCRLPRGGPVSIVFQGRRTKSLLGCIVRLGASSGPASFFIQCYGCNRSPGQNRSRISKRAWRNRPNGALGVDPEAQPYQDLIDRIFYRMAGLTDVEAQGLENRLREML